MALAIAVLAGSAAQGSETRRGLVIAPSTVAHPTTATSTPTPSRSRRASSPPWEIGCTGRTRVATMPAGARLTSKHMVATSEAHDSRLCAADAATKRRFAGDLLNLTLAVPAVDRPQKSGKDAGEWMPRMNRCWFTGRVVVVKRKYGLTVDAREARALEGVLSRCSSTEMVVAEGQAQVAELGACTARHVYTTLRDASSSDVIMATTSAA